MSEKRKRVGFTCGAFDLLHAGHVLMLKEARQQCDYLIVGLHTDPSLCRAEKSKPIQSVTERMIQLSAVTYVGSIILYDTEEDLMDILTSVRPDVRILGWDHVDKDFTGQELDMDIYFNSRNHTYSSSELRQRIHDAHGKRISKLIANGIEIEDE